MDKPVLERMLRQYHMARKSNFWDMWGIVASPATISMLRAEAASELTVYSDGGSGTLEKIFGLVVIPLNIDDDKAYIVDEMLGRTILRGKGDGQCR